MSNKKRERPVLPWASVLVQARRANDHYSMTERQQELIYELALTVPEGGRIVELGVCHGKTAVILAIVAWQIDGEYWGIDNWSLEGSMTEVGLLLDSVMNGLDPRVPERQQTESRWAWDGASHRWQLFQADTHADHWRTTGDVDLLIIDAGHDEANVSKDCAVWIPRVKPGGMVIFDDWPSGLQWEQSCHAAVRKHAEIWTANWEWVASYGKVVARRRPL